MNRFFRLTKNWVKSKAYVRHAQVMYIGLFIISAVC